MNTLMRKSVKKGDPDEPPRYRTYRPLGAVKRFRKEPISLLSDARNAHGHAVRVRVAHRRIYLFFGDEHVKRILQVNRENYPKGGYSQLESLIGDGLLSSEGERWRHQRAVIQPAFHRDSVDKMIGTMTAATHRLVERWEKVLAREESVVGVEREMTRLTLDIVSRTLFGYDVGESADEASDALRFVLRYNTDRLGQIISLPLWLPTRDNVRYKRSLETLEGIVHDVIQRRRAEPQRQNDLLEMLMSDVDGDENETAAYKQLRDQIMTFLITGHETTAMALTWAFYLLQQNPEKSAQLRGELTGVLGGRSPHQEDLPLLRYTDAVLKESLRLYPPVWGLVRKIVEDDVIGGYRIRKSSRLMGSRLIISPYVTHRDPELWDDADSFRPERWLDGSTRDLPDYSYFPFSGGQRQCVGQRFALTEATIILATLFQKFSLDLPHGEKVDTEAIFTLKPANGMRMTLSKLDRY